MNGIAFPFSRKKTKIAGKTLIAAVRAYADKSAPALVKYLNEANLTDWKDLTKSNLNDFKDLVTERVAQSTARTYFAVFKTVLKRFEDEADFCKDYREILTAKNVKPVKTFLTVEELERLERVEVLTIPEQYVLDEFLIGAYTGMRLSDAKCVSCDNMANGNLSYISKKTGIHAIVPLKNGVAERVERVQRYRRTMSTAGYNKALRRLCQRAGINERVTVYKAGKSLKGEKWEFISSHSARISFATNLSILGVQLIDIAKLMGHSSIGMTERYIVPTQIHLNDAALGFFK